MVAPPQVLGIDWGTTNRRAYLVDASGACLRLHEDDCGVLAERGRYSASLAQLRKKMAVADNVPVVMSGMVGSALGWQEVPYLEPALPLRHLHKHLVPLRDAGAGRCFIVPGYRLHGAVCDVMRGEETQALGAVALGHGDACLVLPGTHSKWVRIRAGRIRSWSTYMTGELFSLLSREGTLASMLADASSADEEADFDAGLVLARQRLPLSHALFTIRAAVVSGRIQASRARGMASGLLIGTEFAATRWRKPITLLGSDLLAGRYARAAASFGLDAIILHPHETYCAAMAHCLTKGALHAR